MASPEIQQNKKLLSLQEKVTQGRKQLQVVNVYIYVLWRGILCWPYANKTYKLACTNINWGGTRKACDVSRNISRFPIAPKHDSASTENGKRVIRMCCDCHRSCTCGRGRLAWLTGSSFYLRLTANNCDCLHTFGLGLIHCFDLFP